MHHQRHFDRVRGLVAGQTGVPEAEITLETRLVEDLGMDGDDGHEFLETFAHEFGVDMGGMAPLNYFGDEPPIYGMSLVVPLLASVSSRFRGYARHAARGRRTLTVRNLVVSAQARRWIRPEGRPDDPTRLTLAGAVRIAAVVALTVWGCLFNAAVAVVLTALWAFALLNFIRSLSLLRRLDAAASLEEHYIRAAG